jgi:hypothetical protein
MILMLSLLLADNKKQCHHNNRSERVIKIRKSAYLQPKGWSLTALFSKADF